VRSVNTSVVALLPIASILFIGAFVLGAGTLKDLSLALFVGVAIGTYSSIFIATPVLADLREREPEMAALRKRVLSRRAGTPLVPSGRRARGGAAAAAVPVATAGTATAVLEPGDDPLQASGDGAAPTAPSSGAARPPRQTGPRNQPKRKSNRRK
jgi:preprotein translocase subunit SecF